MLAAFPRTCAEIQDWTWAEIAPFYNELENLELTEANINEWLAAWTLLYEVVTGRLTWARVKTSQNSADEVAEQEFNFTLKNILPNLQSAQNRLIEKFLASKLEVNGMEIPLQKLRVVAEIFREENLPLQTEEQTLVSEYGKITSRQGVEWDAEPRTLLQLKPYLQSTDRAVREKAWRLSMQRTLQDRSALNELWAKLLKLRVQIAKNTGLDYREYKWKQLDRFDYTPADCAEFHAAIESEIVPAARRIMERRRQQLGVETVRPWDLDVEPLGRPPLRPAADMEELESRAQNIFAKVDPDFGEYYATMRRENLLDLANRPNKRPGGYSTAVRVRDTQMPFIFMNAVGAHSDVTTLLHEAGHAFHGFERRKLPYYQQRMVGAEFSEVASMAMEMLGLPYLTKVEGGYYSEAEAARAQIQELESSLLLWPYIAVVDAFQHWVYTNPEAALDAANCDREWGKLWQRFMNFVDWSGLEDECVTGWHRKLHIFQLPFYYVEYGIAQLGAIQIWANSLQNQQAALQAYRKALALGGTASLPELYKTAGAKFALDATVVREAVTLIEEKLATLYQTV